MSMPHQKVTTNHLRRDAYLYVRQSTIRQVTENVESTRRQYALRERAIALGWPGDRIIVIDTDLGQSGADRDREGFARLVAEVSLGRAGMVLGLEVSRLARNSTDWHQLLEICASSGTLILDEDGIYDPGDFNDRLLLGLKGTMSEAELHLLRARLQGGILNRAQRGQLKLPLPTGLVYDLQGQVVLDPDAQIQHSITLLFDTFTRTGSATATVKHFREAGLRFPSRLQSGAHKGELHWRTLEHARVLRVLHNPRYAGAFVFGRTRTRRCPGGGSETRVVAQNDWRVVLPDTHPGYISWQCFEANRRQLQENAHALGIHRRSAPREGPALLQGLAVCGVCGSRMTVRYHVRRGQRVPDYLCQKAGIATGHPVCQQVPGAAIDRAVGQLLVDLMAPVTLEVALQIQAELNSRAEEADVWRTQQVQRAHEEANLARRRFMQTHPDNRMVADVLEAEWNTRLREVDEAQHQLNQYREAHHRELDESQRQRILRLTTDFPRLWNDPATPHRERKRMARLLIEDVTVTKAQQLSLGVRLRGGATRRLTLDRALPPGQTWKTPTEVIAQINTLLDHHPDAEVARILNRRGYRSGKGGAFGPRGIQRICQVYAIPKRYHRLRARGLLTIHEMADQLNVPASTIKQWHRDGLLQGQTYNNRHQYLYEKPINPPAPQPGGKRRKRAADANLVPQRTIEVQYDA